VCFMTHCSCRCGTQRADESTRNITVDFMGERKNEHFHRMIFIISFLTLLKFITCFSASKL